VRRRAVVGRVPGAVVGGDVAVTAIGSTPKALGVLADSTGTTSSTTTPKALGVLADSTGTTSSTTTPKALGVLAGAERHILAALG
jgi:hypothetical protein